MRVRRLLANNALVMSAAFVLAMLLGGFPEAVPGITNGTISMLALGAMMSFSLCNLRFRGLKVSRHAGAAGRAFLLSFVASSGLTLLLALLFSGDLRDGWVLVAAVPSAVSVIPFCFLLRGELEATLVSSAALYLAALLVTPLMTLLFIGEAVSPATVLWYVGALILVPMALSRGVRALGLSEEGRHIGVNLAFAVLVIAVAGTNREVFFSEPGLLLALVAVALLRTFGAGVAYDRLARRSGVARERRVPEVLFLTHKNTGMAAALAMNLLGPGAAVPAAVLMSVDIVWLIYVTRSLAPPCTVGY